MGVKWSVPVVLTRTFLMPHVHAFVLLSHLHVLCGERSAPWPVLNRVTYLIIDL